MRALPFLLLFFITHAAAQSRSHYSMNKYFSARWYDRYQGTARVSLVQELQDRDWQAVDTLYGMPDQNGKRKMETAKVDLAPFANEDGYIVYWVPEVAPQFPGGEQVLQQYINDVEVPNHIDVEDGRRSTVYVRCTIGIDGRVEDVAEEGQHREWIPAEIARNCVDAVRYMPPWTPGLFRGKPVRVVRLIIFTLSE